MAKRIKKGLKPGFVYYSKPGEGDLTHPAMQVNFSIPWVPPSLNVMLRMHWIKRSTEQKKWDLAVFAKWIDLNKPLFLKPVKILYTLRFRTKSRRDYDNYVGATKFITDALKRTFITRDDTEWLKSVEVAFGELGEMETTITITEVE